ncbi:MAG: acyltransferase [Betaproteobacteria bacterium]|nr:acyltransferase [Betaproteobacteria bacterium]
MRAAVSRLAFIDALKAFGSQLIVLHHLAFYGPMSDFAHTLAPSLLSWFSQDARIAVQVFLVIGGFLAAKGLAPEGRLTVEDPLALLRRRYVKLAVPYFAALLFSIACAFVAGQWMEHESIPGAPTLRQLLAHALLLQNILGFDAISAGVWYIAIDFQLFALLLGTLWLARAAAKENRAARVLGKSLVAGLALASLFYFNRDATWDDWAIYFFGSYALGVVTWWVSSRKQAPDWLALMAAAVVAALLVDYRSRIAVALLVALALGISRRKGFLQIWPNARPLAFLGEISYSVFLVNFPVCLVVNALFSRFAPEDPGIQALGILIAWAATIAAGALFHRLVESRTGQIMARIAGVMQILVVSSVQRPIEGLRFLLRARLKS